MVFKTILLTFYPTSLRNNYTAKVTDYRQTNASYSANQAVIYIYDIDETPIVNNNPIKIIMTRLNSTGETIRGYKLISNNKVTQKSLSAASSYTLEHSDLRDPGAQVIFYGGGTGQITKSDNSFSQVWYGKYIGAGVIFTISKTSFTYPTPTNGETVIVTPTYNGTNLNIPLNEWTVKWDVKTYGGVQITGITGNSNNNGYGTVNFIRTYNQDTAETPKVQIVLSKFRATWGFSESGDKVTYAIVQVDGASGYSIPHGDMEYTTAPSDAQYQYASSYFSTYYFTWSGGSGWVRKEDVDLSNYTVIGNPRAWKAEDANYGYRVPIDTEVKVTDQTYDSAYGGTYRFTWNASWGGEVSAWVYAENVRTEEREEGTGDYHQGEIGYDDGYGWYIQEYT